MVYREQFAVMLDTATKLGIQLYKSMHIELFKGLVIGI